MWRRCTVPKECEADRCDKPARAKGLCENHYRQERYKANKRQRYQASAKCDRGSCDQPAAKRGLCTKHYERERGRHRHREDRVLPTRARNRAVSRLITAHREEFDRLYLAALAEVTQENEELKKACEANNAEPTNNKRIYRFKRGPKPEDEEPEDRIVPAQLTCEQCDGYHAGGHRCLHCGSLPSRKIIDDPKKSPILVPADMTDERIAAAVARSGGLSRQDKLDELAEVSEAYPNLDSRAVCAKVGLRMDYDARAEDVLAVLEAAGRQVRRQDKETA